MEVLRTAVSALSFYDADEKDNSHDANVRKAYNLTAQIAMIVAIYDRLRKGKEVVPPDRSLSHAANFLWMLNGVKPSETAVAPWIWLWSSTPSTNSTPPPLPPASSPPPL
jgi:citrate synthase